MAFFRRAKQTKVSKESKEGEKQQRTDSFDMFSGLEIAPAAEVKSTSNNLNDIQDLNLEMSTTKAPTKEEHVKLHKGKDDEEEVFPFLVQETDNTDSTLSETIDKPTEHDINRPDTEVQKCPTDSVSEPVKDICATEPASNKPTPNKSAKKVRKKRAIRPGQGNTSNVTTNSNLKQGTKKAEEDTVSIKSDTSSVHSVQDHEDNQLSSAKGSLNEENEHVQDQAFLGSSSRMQCTEEIQVESDTEMCSVDASSGQQLVSASEIKSSVDLPMISTCENKGSDDNLCLNNQLTDNENNVDKNSSNDFASSKQDLGLKIGNAHENLIKDDVDQISDRTTSNKETSYVIELDDDQKLMLMLESLQSQQKALQVELDELDEKQNELISNWKSEHLTESEMKLRIKALSEKQALLVTNENYAEAAEIDQEIIDLQNQFENIKYIHPILNKQFIELLKEFHNVHTTQENKKKELYEQYKEILDSQSHRIKEKDKIKEKQLDDHVLVLKEKKLKLERDLSHAQLDKKHLLKNESVLNEEIEKKTTLLTKDKNAFLEKRSAVQEEITDLKLKLALLEKTEEEYTNNIDNIDQQIQSIINEFQPRVESIRREKEMTEKNELQIYSDMEALVVKEEAVTKEKEILHEEQEKNKMLLKELQAFNDTASDPSKMEFFSFDQVFSNSKLLGKITDEEYSSLKTLLSEREEELQRIKCQILENQTNQSNLQRSLNDLETKVSELQVLKQVAVKERKFKEAQKYSDEIKALTAEGKAKQETVCQLDEAIKQQQPEAEKLEDLVKEVEKNFQEQEIKYDMQIIKNLKEAQKEAEETLNSHPHIWIRQTIELQLDYFKSIVQSLETKHDLNEHDPADNQGVNKMELQLEIEELEAKLKLVVDEEDWETADKLNYEIEAKQELMKKC
ncbi:myosin heavy chain, striated muscle-like isoform X1 [Hydractinia symbiolongicarpus]|uniref:myosin heavy chain, striated muscle-like isoform X1 n=1 Tax=Hydractinia symbiolongicarpus TaxID=13093 RepID=UPI0025515C5F|nr:myosin heavy chain, striated muscle-like isoform X1 [Hydractinia symbiolongicarpus]